MGAARFRCSLALYAGPLCCDSGARWQTAIPVLAGLPRARTLRAAAHAAASRCRARRRPCWRHDATRADCVARSAAIAIGAPPARTPCAKSRRLGNVPDQRLITIGHSPLFLKLRSRARATRLAAERCAARTPTRIAAWRRADLAERLVTVAVRAHEVAQSRLRGVIVAKPERKQVPATRRARLPPQLRARLLVAERRWQGRRAHESWRQNPCLFSYYSVELSS